MAALPWPEGLQQLIELDSVLVRQKTTRLTNNKYVLLRPDGSEMLYANEDSSAFNVIFGGKERTFHINIFDMKNQQIMSLRRPRTFGPDKMEVTVAGQLVSIVRQELTFFKPVLSVNDTQDTPVLRIKGPIGTTGYCDFDVYGRNKQQIGVIQKKWGGLVRELFTDSDSYEIRFPRDLDVRYKAALIGACFLIDFIYYEH